MMLILIIAIFLFISTSAIGIVLFINKLSGEFISRAVILAHGSIAGLGLFIIIFCLFLGGSSVSLALSTFLLTTAAFLGLSLVNLPVNKKAQTALTILHPILAIAGIILLVISILT